MASTVVSHKGALNRSTFYSLLCCLLHLAKRPSFSHWSMWHLLSDLPISAVFLRAIFCMEAKLNIFKSINQNIDLFASSIRNFPLNKGWNSYDLPRAMWCCRDMIPMSTLPYLVLFSHVLCVLAIRPSLSLSHTQSLPVVFCICPPDGEFSHRNVIIQVSERLLCPSRL